MIGADTIVLLGKEILNKPKDLRQAKEYLKALSGNLHYVYTGINVINTKNKKVKFAYEKTSVHFRTLRKMR
ncbi:MAG: Maf family protein [Ignavibacteria bacterium]|nr:Maf family protein [Ignavibacteria bacterium]